MQAWLDGVIKLCNEPISLRFWGCLRILNFIVIGQYAINIIENFQVLTVFWVWQLVLEGLVPVTF